MKSIVKISVLFVTLFLVLSSGYAISEEMGENEKKVTITGVVSENFQIITDKEEVFEIASNEEGDEVVKLVGEKVRVKGILSTYEDEKYIHVESYEVVK